MAEPIAAVAAPTVDRLTASAVDTSAADTPWPSGDDVDLLLDRVFDRFRRLFDARRTCGENGVFGFEVSAPDGVRRRYVSVTGGRCNIDAVAPADPNAVIALDLPTLFSLATGRITGADGYITGRITVAGDVLFAMNWSEWFGPYEFGV